MNEVQSLASIRHPNILLLMGLVLSSGKAK
jgi:hypothetical protein